MFYFAENLEVILKRYKECASVDGVTLFNVTREDVVGAAIRAISRPSFNAFKLPSVMFMDQYETPEGAIDAGGPRREFFRLALKELASGPLFEGILFCMLYLCINLNYRMIKIRVPVL